MMKTGRSGYPSSSAVAALVAGLVLVTPAAAGDPPSMRLAPVASGLTHPILVCAPAGDLDRLFIVEKDGRIKIMDLASGFIHPAPFFDGTSFIATDFERGIHAVAFAPDYATSGEFYVSYSLSPSTDSMISRFRVSADPNVADMASEEVLLRYARPLGHTGGWIGFGADGFLYYGSGDGGTFDNPDPLNRSQDIVDQPMGKVMRIDVSGGDDFPRDPKKNFAIPADNPFVGRVGDDEIWAYGIRQPWRCAFDRVTGTFFIADVGQETWEEIEIEPPATSGFAGGRNYGWKCMEADDCTGFGGCTCFSAELTSPDHAYGHDLGCSITGGVVYHGCSVPSLAGRYLFADYCSGRIWSLDWQGAAIDVQEHTDELNPIDAPVAIDIVSFGEDAAGEVYVCTWGGTVYRLGAAGVPDCDNDGRPDSCETSFGTCPDLDQNGSVGSADLAILLGAWGSSGPGDLNGNGTVGSEDIAILLGAWSF